MTNGQNRVVSAGGLALNVYEWGSAAKPPYILLHGLASSSHMFDLIAPELAPAYHVIAYDQRGHGLSDKPESGYDFETIAADLDRLMEALGLGDVPFALAGHSWGASTALYYAATRPKRVSKAALIDGGLRPVRDHFASVEAMKPPQRQHWALDEVKRMIREDWLGAVWRPELEPLVLSIYDTSDPNDVKPRLKVDNHMKIAEALWNFTPADYYARVQCPLLVIAALGGDAPDERLHAYAVEAQQANRLCRVAWMPKTIHDIPWQRPHELAGMLG